MCFLGGCDFSANKQTLFVVCSRHACFVCFWVCCCCCCCCLLLLLSVLHLVCPRWLDFIWAVWRRLDSILTILGRLDLIWVVCLWICVMTCRLGHWRSWGSGKEDKHRDEIHIPCKDTDVGKEEGVSKRHCTCKLCNSVVREAHGSLCKFWHEHHHHPGWPPCLHDEMMMLHHLLDCHHTPLCSAPADSMQPPAVVLAEDWTLVQLSWLGKSWPCSPSDVLPDSLASHALLVVSFVASSSQVPSLSPVVAMTLLPQQQQQVPASAVASSLPVVALIAHPERKRSTQNPFSSWARLENNNNITDMPNLLLQNSEKNGAKAQLGSGWGEKYWLPGAVQVPALWRTAQFPLSAAATVCSSLHPQHRKEIGKFLLQPSSQCWLRQMWLNSILKNHPAQKQDANL